MSNPLFSALGGNNSIMSMLQQLKSNPAVLLAKRFNLPDGIQSDPHALRRRRTFRRLRFLPVRPPRLTRCITA